MTAAAGMGMGGGYVAPGRGKNTEEKPSRGGSAAGENEAQSKLVRKLVGFIAQSDRFEEQRRKTDRTGGNIFYGRHWNVQVASNRAAITCNVARALIEHKISIQTKQLPVPVVEAADEGDAEGAKKMRSCIMQWWENDDMQGKLERALIIANTTRSCALKGYWDTGLADGNGDITFEVRPGWQLIVDSRTDDPKKMRFGGDRMMVPRQRAIQMYPHAAEFLSTLASAAQQGPAANAGGSGSPLRDQWQKSSIGFPTTAIVNSIPTLLSYTGSAPQQQAGQDLVQLAEIYHRDGELVPITRDKRDKKGNIEMQPVKDDDGFPVFNQVASTQHEEAGIAFEVPHYELAVEPVQERVWVKKYPYWRRTTLALPTGKIVEDIAWDYPLPYAYCHDGDVIEGFWRMGSILALESLQGALNVSISTMLDNLRFSAYRAYIAYSGSMIDRNNMNIQPGEILRAGEKGTLDPLPVTEISQAWFAWVNLVITLMERVIGATGIMQGEAAGRVDSASGYDMLAEIGGSTLVKATQRMERTIADVCRIAGAFMQKHYHDGNRSIGVETGTPQERHEPIEPGALLGKFNYKVLTGSSLAWSESAVRARVLEELNNGLRDKISAWKALHIDDWRAILERQEDPNLPPQLQLAPPGRTRQHLPSAQKQRQTAPPQTA